MKKIVITTIVASLLLIGGYYASKKYVPTQKASASVKTLVENNAIQSGDLIFHTSQSRQSKAIQLATHSTYSHCGIIFNRNNDWYVIEAAQPIKWTPLSQWIARGKNGHYVIKRLSDSQALTTNKVQQLKKAAEQHLGKNYDLTFEWADDKIYCSELIWKAYKSALDVEVGKLQQLSEFDLTDPIVKSMMQKRYGTKIPLTEIVISPQAIFESERLKTVKAN
jgi:uncharacterized protein YycO